MFDVHQSIYDRHGEQDEERVAEYIDGLMADFAASPEAKPIIQEFGGIHWAASMMGFAFDYLGIPVPELSLPDFNEILFELIPRKVSTEAESATAIVAELRAFWSFLQRQYSLENAGKILETLTDQTKRQLHDALSNPANFGMAKSMFMMGSEAGFDMTTQEGLDAFMLAYNSLLPGVRLPGLPPPGDDDFGPGPALPPPTKEDREKKRKARKAQRQARKRGRK